MRDVSNFKELRDLEVLLIHFRYLLVISQTKDIKVDESTDDCALNENIRCIISFIFYISRNVNRYKINI